MHFSHNYARTAGHFALWQLCDSSAKSRFALLHSHEQSLGWSGFISLARTAEEGSLPEQFLPLDYSRPLSNLCRMHAGRMPCHGPHTGTLKHGHHLGCKVESCRRTTAQCICVCSKLTSELLLPHGVIKSLDSDGTSHRPRGSWALVLMLCDTSTDRQIIKSSSV